MKSTVLLASVLLCVLSVSADPAHAQVQSCAGQPLGAPCDTDGDLCTNVGFCFSGTCMNEIPVPNGISCEDGLFCTASDTCQSGVCVGGSDPCPGPDGDQDCSERCNETADACTRNDPNGSGCNDGNVCTTGDTCGSGACFGVNANNGTSCASDGTFCNGAEECQSGSCVSPGDPCAGPDGDGDCTESCDEAGDSCTANDLDGSGCDDGEECTANDSCFSGSCILSLNVDNGTPCAPDGTFCNGAEECQSGSCVSPGDPCSGPDGDGDCSETCDEAADACAAPDPDGSACTLDGLFCNGVEECQSGACLGVGDPCTGPDGDADCRESCDEATDACIAPDPDSALCDGGQFVGRKFLFEASATLDQNLVNYAAGDQFEVEAVFSDPAVLIAADRAVATYIPGSVRIVVNGSPVGSTLDPFMRYEENEPFPLTVAFFPPGNTNAVLFLGVALSVIPNPLEAFLDLFPLDDSSPEVVGWFIEANEDGTLPSSMQATWSVTSLPSSGAVPDGARVVGVPLTLAHSAVPGDLDLSWGASCAVTDDDYAVYEGVLGDFTSHIPVTASSCTTIGATTTTITPGGGDRYYLVVPTGASGLCEGSYGFASDGTPRPQSLSACAAQSVNECAQRKTVFVTSVTYDGNLGGLAGADANCQALADAAGLGGTYKAWLSDSSTDARDRLTHATVPYVRTDGASIADDWADLVDNPAGDPLLNPIDRDENGNAVGNVRVWTGTTFAGQMLPGDTICSDWLDGTASFNGRTGRTNRVDLGWTSVLTLGCNTLRALYCFEQ